MPGRSEMYYVTHNAAGRDVPPALGAKVHGKEAEMEAMTLQCVA